MNMTQIPDIDPDSTIVWKLKATSEQIKELKNTQNPSIVYTVNTDPRSRSFHGDKEVFILKETNNPFVINEAAGEVIAKQRDYAHLVKHGIC